MFMKRILLLITIFLFTYLADNLQDDGSNSPKEHQGIQHPKHQPQEKDADHVHVKSVHVPDGKLNAGSVKDTKNKVETSNADNAVQDNSMTKNSEVTKGEKSEEVETDRAESEGLAKLNSKIPDPIIIKADSIEDSKPIIEPETPDKANVQSVAEKMENAPTNDIVTEDVTNGTKATVVPNEENKTEPKDDSSTEEKVDSDIPDTKTIVEEEPNEEIPSFKEFRQKKEEESIKIEKQIENKDLDEEKLKPKKVKVIQKNYADTGCGAKIVSNEKEFKNTGTLLNSNKDLYAMIPCESNIWFVVNLCDTIQIHAIQLANYELFSSSINEFKIYTAETYPPKEWVEVGKFSTVNNRNLQKFDIASNGQYSKFVRFEKVTHRGKEHFCVLSTFKVLGMSMVDEYEEQNQSQEDVDTDPYEVPLDSTKDPVDKIEKGDGSLISGARTAVKNMMDSALNAIGINSNNSTQTNVTNTKEEAKAVEEVKPDPVVVKVDEQGKEIKKNEPDLRLKGESGNQEKAEEKKPVPPKEPIMEGINLAEEDATTCKSETVPVKDTKGEVLQKLAEPETKADVAEKSEEKGEQVQENKEVKETKEVKENKEVKDTKGVVLSNSPKKNSIFVELDKKIKELEKNLSLSNDYLETLSSRYKKVDSLFKPLEKTLHTVDELMQNFEERLKRLEEQFTRFDSTLENHTILMNEVIDKSNTLITSTNLIIFLLIIVLYLFWRMSYKLLPPPPVAKSVKVLTPEPTITLSQPPETEQQLQVRKRRKSKQKPAVKVSSSAGVLFSHKSESNLAGAKKTSENKKPLESVQMDLIYPQPKSPPAKRRTKLR